MEGKVEGKVKVRGRVRFGVVGGGFAYRADLLAWSSRPIRTTARNGGNWGLTTSF